MTSPRAFRRLVLLGSALLVSACATTRRYPVTPLPVQLVSPTPFLVHVRARADTAANSCQVLRITGTVSSMEGDTLEFARVWSDRRPRGASDCLEGRPGFVVRSSAPDVRGETTVVPAGSKSLFAAFVLFTALLTFLAMASS
ncbi:MAG: hypothetical protein IT357_12300 [Gemmatimonadaceae bacterium]|nr:hypothetical protein [Gemmatimonadaceae bacterium]